MKVSPAVQAFSVVASMAQIAIADTIAPNMLAVSVAFAFSLSDKTTQILRSVMNSKRAGLEAIADYLNVLRTSDPKKTKSNYAMYLREWKLRNAGKATDSRGEPCAACAYGIISRKGVYKVVSAATIAVKEKAPALVTATEAMAIVQQARELLSLASDADATAILAAMVKLADQLTLVPTAIKTKRAPLRAAA